VLRSGGSAAVQIQAGHCVAPLTGGDDATAEPHLF
jgi:hypothetical protein